VVGAFRLPRWGGGSGRTRPPTRRGWTVPTLRVAAVVVLAGGLLFPGPAVQADEPLPTPLTQTVRYGPILLLPTLLGLSFPAIGVVPVIPMPCQNCYVTGTSIDLVYENGQSANLDSGVMLHHLVLAEAGSPDPTCAGSNLLGLFGHRLFASGNERTAGDLPPGFGVHLGMGPMAAAFDIMNHSSELKIVYVQAEVHYLPDSTPGIKPVTPIWLDMANCTLSTYAIPAGPTDSVWRWQSNITGRIVAAGGHVHDTGVKTVLTNETTGEHICTSVAGYGTKPQYMGSIESMTTCIHDRIGTVRAGETLALDTFYNSPVPLSDVMGIMIAYVYETEDLEGGTPPPEAMAPPPAGGMPAGTMHHH
jgi:hypothetical protein